MSSNRLTGYDKALRELKDMAIAESITVRQHVAEAVQTLAQDGLTDDWRVKDDIIDRYRDAIVDRSFELMTWQQLRAQDLRWILGFQRIAQELERIADYACDLAELSQLRPTRIHPQEIGEMTRQLLVMLDFDVSILKDERAIDRDLDELDDVLDALYAQFRQELVREDEKSKTSVDLGVSLLLARTIERMGDHAVNVAEMVLYVQTGKRRIGAAEAPSP